MQKIERLTPRERQVFDHLVDGGETRTIAVELGISRSTVQAHRNAIAGKLGSANPASLLRLALRAGVVKP